MSENAYLPEDVHDAKLPWLPILIGFVGVVLGIVAIVQANAAKKESQNFAESLNDRLSQAMEVGTQFQDMDRRLVAVASKMHELDKSLEQTQEQVQRVVSSMTREIQNNRETLVQMNKNYDSIKKAYENLKEILESGNVGMVRYQSSAAYSEGGNVVEIPEKNALTNPGIYKIKSGDTLGKIAARLGTSVLELERLNPGIDPRRLQIGQEIKIP